MLKGPRRLEVRETPDPKICHDTDVLIRIDYAGICGSDLHYFRTGRVGDQVATDTFVMGHESVGTVLEIGKAVSSVQPGDRVAIEPAVSCGACDQCRIGRPHTCRNVLFMGSPGELSGALTERVVMPEANCLQLPSDLSSGIGVFAEPMSIALYAWQFLKDVNVETVGILGTGPIGLAVLLAAKERNGVRSFVTDKVDSRLKAAKNLGADWTANPLTEDVVRNAPAEPDAILECCGQQDAVDQALRLLKPGGDLVLVGIPETDAIHLDIHLARRKEITLHNVRRQNGCLEQAVDFCARHPKEIAGLITHSFPLEEVQQAFDLAESYRDNVIKSVIRLHD